MNPNLEKGLERLEGNIDRAEHAAHVKRVHEILMDKPADEGRYLIPEDRLVSMLELLDLEDYMLEMITAASIKIFREEDQQSEDSEALLPDTEVKVYFGWRGEAGTSGENAVFDFLAEVGDQGQPNFMHTDPKQEGSDTWLDANTGRQSDFMRDVRIIIDAAFADDEQWLRTQKHYGANIAEPVKVE